jgi:serine/threonine protein kinase
MHQNAIILKMINSSMREMLVYNYQCVNDKVEVVSLSQGVAESYQLMLYLRSKVQKWCRGSCFCYFLYLQLIGVYWWNLCHQYVCIYAEDIYAHVELITRRSIMHRTIGIPDNFWIDVKNIPIMRIVNYVSLRAMKPWNIFHSN